MPKFHKKPDFNYNKPKFNNNLKKRFQQNFKISKSFNDNSEENSQTKWLKVTCLSETETSVNDIVIKIENILNRITKISVSLKPFNVLINNDTLEFYVKMKKYDINVVMDNIFRIDQYRLKCYKNDEIHVPHEIPINWTESIKLTLSNRYRMIDSTGEAEINLSAFSDDEILINNGLYLSLSSPRVFECVLNLLKSAKKPLSILDLSNNNISTIYKLKTFCECVKIDKLDLRNNRISNINEFNALGSSSIIDLKISGNQLRKITPQELRKKLRSIIPTLISLDGSKLDDPVLIAGASITNNTNNARVHKQLPESIYTEDRNSELYRLILRFLSTFDINRNQIYSYYSTESSVSLSTFGDTLETYRENNTNILRDGSKRNLSKMKRGPGQIVELFMKFPPTKHIEQSIRVDIIQQNNEVIMCTLHGIFAEFGTTNSPGCRARQFSRTLTIVPAGDSPIVIQEHIVLMPNDAALFRKYKPLIDTYRDMTKSRPDLIGVSCETVQMVKEFKDATGMSVEGSIDFLTEITNADPNWKFSSEESWLVKRVKVATAMTVGDCIEFSKRILKSHPHMTNISIDEIRLVKELKDSTRMNISSSIEFLRKFGSLQLSLSEFSRLQSEGAIPIVAFQDE